MRDADLWGCGETILIHEGSLYMRGRDCIFYRVSKWLRFPISFQRQLAIVSLLPLQAFRAQSRVKGL